MRNGGSRLPVARKNCTRALTCARSTLRVRRPGAGSAAGSTAASRLKVVLAADRTGLDETTMAKIRKEIQAVVAKYVEIDTGEVLFDMQNDDELTLVTATFPLVGKRKLAGAMDLAK